MKSILEYINEELLFEASKWSKDNVINDILTNALGQKSEWTGEGNNSILNKISKTFEKWYKENNVSELSWLSSTNDYEPNIKFTEDDRIYDISYGKLEYNNDTYMDPVTIYTTSLSYGIEFYDFIIICLKDGKTLNDLSNEVEQEKDKRKKEQEEAEKRYEEENKAFFEKQWQHYISSDTNPKFKKLEKYNFKVVKANLSLQGFDENYTFIATLCGLWADYPEFMFPLTKDFDVLEAGENKYQTFEDFIKGSKTLGEINVWVGDIIVNNIKEVTDKEREKYCKIVKSVLDKEKNHTFFHVVYDKLFK